MDENAIRQAYLDGFAAKCAEYGVYPEKLAALADPDAANDKNDIFKGIGIVPGKTGYPDATQKKAPPPPPKKVAPPPPKKTEPPKK